VAGALALYGVDPARVTPRGFGPDNPVADNATDEGRRQNRRVELVRKN
jgi:outer membrane protein OmpA-like peptidoglycan-associated protein